MLSIGNPISPYAHTIILLCRSGISAASDSDVEGIANRELYLYLALQALEGEYLESNFQTFCLVRPGFYHVLHRATGGRHRPCRERQEKTGKLHIIGGKKRQGKAPFALRTSRLWQSSGPIYCSEGTFRLRLHAPAGIEWQQRSHLQRCAQQAVDRGSRSTGGAGVSVRNQKVDTCLWWQMRNSRVQITWGMAVGSLTTVPFSPCPPCPCAIVVLVKEIQSHSSGA